jgi:hypothetical protein
MLTSNKALIGGALFLVWSIVVGIVLITMISAESQKSTWAAVTSDPFNIYLLAADAAAMLLGAGALMAGIAARSRLFVARRISLTLMWLAVCYGACASIVIAWVVWNATNELLHTAMAAVAVGAVFALWVIIVRGAHRALERSLH